MIRTFSEEDYQKYKNDRLYGRVIDYSNTQGYGFIRTELDSDIFVSSYALPDNVEARFFFGTTVLFTPAFFKGKYVAQNVDVLSYPESSEMISFPNGLEIYVRAIRKIAYVNGHRKLQNLKTKDASAAEKMKAAGYSERDLDSIQICMRRGGEYSLFRESSPIEGDGRLKDLDGFFDKLVAEYQLL